MKELTMNAVVVNKWGSPEVLEVTEVSIPEYKADQMLIKILASSVNPVDWKHRKGNHKLVLGSSFPIILGYDFCGEIVETGIHIKKFKCGDIIFGDLDNKYGGALAEFAVAHENCITLKPDNISEKEAAAYPLVSLTALQALRDKCNLKKGHTIIINGASGGVGHISIQIAKILGAKVIAIASEKNQEFIKKNGADICIDYRKENILKSDYKADIFLDVHGSLSFLKCKHILNKGGTYINLHPRPKILIHKLLQPFSSGKKAKTILRKHSFEDMQTIANWIKEEKLKVHIDKTFNIKDIVKAHEHSEKGHSIGKTTIEVQF